MEKRELSVHGTWSSGWVFILAATGSAVGLGNIWKFPYIVGENGGGAFVLVYLLCVAFITLPIMMAEILIGRRGRANPIHAMLRLAGDAGRGPLWGVIGWSGAIAGFLILSYYSVVAGWSVSYVFKGLQGAFTDQTPDRILALFTGLQADPYALTFWHSLFMFATFWVVARGVRGGLERAVTTLMPGLFLILLLLLGYSVTTGAFVQGAAFMFDPDWSRLTWEAVLIALGHAFFTLSLGMGSIMIYGAYLPQKASILQTTLVIGVADTVIAILAGLVIFPLVFANGLQPDAGPGLVFITLPNAFAHMTGGAVVAPLFFLLLLFAAWTSAISLIEPAVAWLVERFEVSRVTAGAWCAGLAWLLGLGSVASFNVAKDFRGLFGKTIFDFLDYLTANIMLPLGGALIAVFVAWAMRDAHRRDELAVSHEGVYRLWLWLLRFAAPIGVAVIFLNAIGIDLLGWMR